MIKKTLYPKTTRVKVNETKSCQLTEKIDGSNLCIIKKDDTLYIAQRNYIYEISEMEECKDLVYKGLYQWLTEHKDWLIENMHNNSVLCGEWIGMGCLKYPTFEKRFYMFAKANITEEFELKNIYYYHDLFKYPFVNQEIPEFIGEVPIVDEISKIPTKAELDVIYKEYCEKVNRNVEGIVVNYQNTVTKYVRMKNGKLQEHFDRGE